MNRQIFLHMLLRDLRIFLPGSARGGALLPLLFFLAVLVIYPFAVGPDPELLQKTGGGMIWVAALLAAILPIDRLIAPDVESGAMDQWALRNISQEMVVLLRLIAHWLSFAPLLMLAALPASVLLGLDGETASLAILGLLAGTPGLAAIGVMIAAITAGLRGGSALAGLLILPLAIPILIFGAGALAREDGSGLALCAAISLLLTALAPFVGGAAIRAASNG